MDRAQAVTLAAQSYGLNSDKSKPGSQPAGVSPRKGINNTQNNPVA